MQLIQTKARYNYFSLVAYCLLFFVSTVGVVGFLFETLQQDEISIFNTFFFILILLSIGLWTLRMVLWFIFGEESVHLEERSIIIRRKGTFLIKREKRIPIGKIKAVGLNKTFYELHSPSTLVHSFQRQGYIFGIQNKGRVIFVYGANRTYKCLDALHLNEAPTVIQKFKQAIENAKSSFAN